MCVYVCIFRMLVTKFGQTSMLDRQIRQFLWKPQHCEKISDFFPQLFDFLSCCEKFKF